MCPCRGTVNVPAILSGNFTVLSNLETKICALYYIQNVACLIRLGHFLLFCIYSSVGKPPGVCLSHKKVLLAYAGTESCANHFAFFANSAASWDPVLSLFLMAADMYLWLFCISHNPVRDLVQHPVFKKCRESLWLGKMLVNSLCFPQL